MKSSKSLWGTLPNVPEFSEFNEQCFLQLCPIAD